MGKKKFSEIFGEQTNCGGRVMRNIGNITNSNINMNNGRIVINGREFHGSCVSISNGRVVIDGVVQDGDELVGNVNIEVYGDVDSLENACGNVTARNVGKIITSSGDIECGDVSGSIMTSSGDVKCGNVGGSVKTSSGDIKHR